MSNKTIAALAAAAALLSASVPAAWAEPVKNVVIVHGAFADGAGWQRVAGILGKDGYTVSVVQEPLTSLADDVAATQRVLDLQQGNTLLVGHSYGGAIITEAGNDSHVAGLVYIAAHALDAGETEVSNGKKMPNSTPGEDLVKTPDGYLFLKPDLYPSHFAADLPLKQATFEANAQMPTAAAVFSAEITDPAWKVKPSWYMVAEADKIINPDLERMYAARAKSHTVEIPGASHSVYESHPKEVAALIEQAAQHAQDQPAAS
jgi:pimeloyl-ACP methyl ester carboxylesterase